MQWWLGRDQRFKMIRSLVLNYHEHVYKTPDKQDDLIVFEFSLCRPLRWSVMQKLLTNRLQMRLNISICIRKK